MKRLIFFCLFIISLSASGDKLTLGAGSYIHSQPYKNADPVVLATPIIFYDHTPFYIRWTRIGAYFLGSKSDDFSWGLSVTAQPQIIGYYEETGLGSLSSRKRTAILRGMSERESSWEGGLALSLFKDELYAETMVMHDILGRYNALKLRAEIGVIKKTGKLTFVPGLMAIWLSRPFTNYYFGVPDNEADLSINRPAYQADAALNLAAQIYVKYEFTPQWSTLTYFRTDRFGKSITESPLVGHDYMYSGMVSILYKF